LGLQAILKIENWQVFARKVALGYWALAQMGGSKQ